jgi:hypothetical protein
MNTREVLLDSLIQVRLYCQKGNNNRLDRPVIASIEFSLSVRIVEKRSPASFQ